MANKHKLQIYSKFQLQQAFVDVLSTPKIRRKKYKPSAKFSSGVKKSALRGKCTSVIRFLATPLPRHKHKRRPPIQFVRKSALAGKATNWNINASLPKLNHVRQTKQVHFQRLPRRGKFATNKLLKKLMDKYVELHPSDGEHNEKLVLGTTVHIKCYTDHKTEYPTKYLSELPQKERKVFNSRMNEMSKPKEKPKPPKPNRGPKKPLKEFQRMNELAYPRNMKITPIQDPSKEIEKEQKASLKKSKNN